ncbi:hypothetical protein Tco_1427256, partial [Tanacetum coccineum]
MLSHELSLYFDSLFLDITLVMPLHSTFKACHRDSLIFRKGRDIPISCLVTDLLAISTLNGERAVVMKFALVAECILCNLGSYDQIHQIVSHTDFTLNCGWLGRSHISLNLWRESPDVTFNLLILMSDHCWAKQHQFLETISVSSEGIGNEIVHTEE